MKSNLNSLLTHSIEKIIKLNQKNWVVSSLVLTTIILLLQCSIIVGQTVVTLSTEISWTCPAGVNTIQVECWGAGGGGGGSTSNTARAGGGGAGGSYVKNTVVTVIPGTVYTISIGTGGIAGTGSSTTVNGGAGGSTVATFGSTIITAVGGAGGFGGSSTSSPTVGVGVGGAGSTTGNTGFSGLFNYAGGNGATGVLSTRSGGGGGAAGSNGIGGNASATDVLGGIAGIGGGKGADGKSVVGAGSVGNVPGGGGSGGYGSAKVAGAGGAGRIIITYTAGPSYPTWTAGFPKTEITSYTSFTAKVNISTTGKAYFVVVPSGSTAPTSAQIKAGQDASSSTLPVNQTGTIDCLAALTEYSASVSGLTEGTTYDVYFVAEDAVPTLQIATVKTSVSLGSSLKTDQTITFLPMNDKLVGDADFSPSASSTSDLELLFSSSNLAVATIVNGNVHIIGAGTTIITASQPGNALFNAAFDVTQTLIITALSKLNQSINFPAFGSKGLGDADFIPGAVASSGLAVSYTSSNTSVATIVSGNIHIVGSGSTTITASQVGDATYNAASEVSQLLTIKSNQTITFPAILTKNLEDADFNPGATSDAMSVSTDPTLFLNTTRFAAVTVTSGVKFATVTNYKGTVQDLFCDVYQPTGDVSSNRPCIIWLHGGGFRTGSVRTQGYIVTYATAFAKRGYVCISVDYRLRAAGDMPTQADEFPALQDAARDANTALDWIKSNAANYRVNPAYLFVAGGSAGGRTAATVAQFDGPDPTATTSPETAYKTKAWSKEGFIAAGILWGGEEVEMRGWTYPYLAANPIPSVLVHGDADTTIPVQNSIDLAAALTAAGVTNELHIIPGAQHTPTGATNDPNIQKWMGDFFVKEWKKVIPSGSYPITYTSSNTNVATIVNGNIHIVGAGTTTITATQAGDATYNSAQVSQTLTVKGITTVMDIEGKSNQDFTVFSNTKSSNLLNLNLTGYENMDLNLNVFSIQGQHMFGASYSGTNFIKLDVEPFLPKGTYIISIKSEKSTITKKIILN